MKKILLALLMSITLQSSIKAASETFKIINTLKELNTIEFKHQSILCLENELFTRLCIKSFHAYGSTLISGRLKYLLKTLKLRCSIIFLLRTPIEPQFTITDETIKYLNKEYPDIHTIVLIDSKDKKFIEALKRRNIISFENGALRVSYIADNLSPFDMKEQKELNQLYIKKPQNKKYNPDDYDFLHLQ